MRQYDEPYSSIPDQLDKQWNYEEILINPYLSSDIPLPLQKDTDEDINEQHQQDLFKVKIELDDYVSNFIDIWSQVGQKIHPTIYQTAKNYTILKISRSMDLNKIEFYYLKMIQKQYLLINNKDKILELQQQFGLLKLNNNLNIEKNKQIYSQIIFQYLRFELYIDKKCEGLAMRIINYAINQKISKCNQLVANVAASTCLAFELIKKWNWSKGNYYYANSSNQISLKRISLLLNLNMKLLSRCYNKIYPRRFQIVPEVADWHQNFQPTLVSLSTLRSYFTSKCQNIIQQVKVGNQMPEKVRPWKEILEYLDIQEIVAMKLQSKQFYRLIQDTEIWRRILARDYPKHYQNACQYNLNQLVGLYGQLYTNTCFGCKTIKGKQRYAFKVNGKLHLYCLNCNQFDIIIMPYVHQSLTNNCKQLAFCAFLEQNKLIELNFVQEIQWQMQSKFDTPKLKFDIIKIEYLCSVGKRILNVIEEIGYKKLVQVFKRLDIHQYVEIINGFQFKWRKKMQELSKVEIFYLLYVMFEQPIGLDNLHAIFSTKRKEKRKRSFEIDDSLVKKVKY